MNRVAAMHGKSVCVCSGVKYFSKNTWKYYLSSFLMVSVLYFITYIFDNFYFTTFLKKIMYFTPYVFPDTQKYVTFGMLSRTGKWTNSHTYQENILGHLYCLWSNGLTKRECFNCKWCLSAGVCPWLSVKYIYIYKNILWQTSSRLGAFVTN